MTARPPVRLLADVLFLTGAALVITGLATISVAAAYIAAGCLCMAPAVSAAIRRRKDG